VALCFVYFLTCVSFGEINLDLTLDSSFSDAGGALEDTQGSCMMERRLQRKTV